MEEWPHATTRINVGRWASPHKHKHTHTPLFHYYPHILLYTSYNGPEGSRPCFSVFGLFSVLVVSSRVAQQHKLPGGPPLVPSKSPLPAGTKYYYLGRQEIRDTYRLIGRGDAIFRVERILEGETRRKFVCLSGVGGIGLVPLHPILASKTQKTYKY